MSDKPVNDQEARLALEVFQKIIDCVHVMSPQQRTDALNVLDSVLADLKSGGEVHCAGCGRTALNGECDGV